MNDPLLQALNLLFEDSKEKDLQIEIYEEEENEKEEITISCFECGAPIHEKDDGCLCGFKFDENISCLYQTEGICSVTGFGCDIEGFDYEECDIFRKEHK